MNPGTWRFDLADHRFNYYLFFCCPACRRQFRAARRRPPIIDTYDTLNQRCKHCGKTEIYRAAYAQAARPKAPPK